MYAIIRSGNKQFPVRVGSVVKVDRLSEDEGSSFTVSDVIFSTDDNGVIVKGASVTATVLEHALDDKVLIFKKRRRKNFRRKRGFRHSVTFLKVESITA